MLKSVFPDSESHCKLLAPYRVLDLTDERGLAAGRFLADLGADVVQVEPPEGSSARRLHPQRPVCGGEPVSTYWLAYAHNKRGVTCDVTTPLGRELLELLCATADVVVTSCSGDESAARGTSYSSLASVNPLLIHVAVTPFGEHGPKKSYPDSDLVMWAAAGVLHRNRHPNRPPVRITAPMQSYLHAAADAAVGAVLALIERSKSRRGQQVDVSVQQSFTMANFKLGLYPLNGSTSPPEGRATSSSPEGPYVWRTADGYVHLNLTSGPATGHFTNRLLAWLAEEKAIDETLSSIDFVAAAQSSGSGTTQSAASFDRPCATATEGPRSRLDAALADFLRARATKELVDEARRRGVLVAPINRVEDVVRDPHLEERRAWFDTGHYRLPGPFARFSDGPIQNLRPAPQLGEHNDEIYLRELGLPQTRLRMLRAKGVI
jgi:crotonobetainyl-CoA:carnitine CoA-transferase CaiB-like acyl-CoA transferase